MDFEFTYHNLDVVAKCQFDIREDYTYLGNIDFDIFNELGEDITDTVSGVTLLAVHNIIVDLAQQKRDLHRGDSSGI